ncbi:MAG: hypothetical protein QW734_10175, partial [Candidatus Bathyarchaeia archaeon]
LHGETDILQGPELLAGGVVAPKEPHGQFLEGAGPLVVKGEFFGYRIKLNRSVQGIFSSGRRLTQINTDSSCIIITSPLSLAVPAAWEPKR